MKNTKTLNRIITAVLLICVMLSSVGVTAYATSDTDVVVVEDGDVGAAPAKVPYVVSHEYYCDGEQEYASSETYAGDAGSVITAESLFKKVYAGGAEYTFSSASQDSLVLIEGEDNEIVLRYDRSSSEGVRTKYIVTHRYYTNGELWGSRSEAVSANVGDTVAASDMKKSFTFGENTYTFTSASCDSFIVSGEGKDEIVLRYDRKEENFVAKVPYVIRHEYYTNGKLDCVIPVEMDGADGDVVAADDVIKMPVQNQKTYTFTSAAPASVKLVVGGENAIVMRYDRTAASDSVVETGTKKIQYLVRHEYYCDGVLESEVSVKLDGAKGTVINATDIYQMPFCNKKVYTSMTMEPKSRVLAVGEDNTITVRYSREKGNDSGPEYVVVQEYYDGGKMAGSRRDVVNADISVIAESVCAFKCAAFNAEMYSFDAANSKIAAVADGGKNKIVLRYNRITGDMSVSGGDAKKVSSVGDATHPVSALSPDAKPEADVSEAASSVAPVSPQTGYHTSPWVLVLAVAAVPVMCLLVALAAKASFRLRYYGKAGKK